MGGEEVKGELVLQLKNCKRFENQAPSPSRRENASTMLKQTLKHANYHPRNERLVYIW